MSIKAGLPVIDMTQSNLGFNSEGRIVAIDC